jgi:multiple sugar transport system permease protein
VVTPVRRARQGHWWVYLILTIGLVAVVSPFAWMLLSSVKPDREILRSPPTWLPAQATGEQFADLFQRLDLTTYLGNSVFVAIAVTLGNLAFCSMLGYVLAKISFGGRRLLFVLVMGMLMVPGMVTFVPLFILVGNAGMANSYAGLILPFLVQPVGVFLMPGQNSIDYGLLLAGAVVVVVPVLLLFVSLQRHFTQGIATTGFK